MRHQAMLILCAAATLYAGGGAAGRTLGPRGTDGADLGAAVEKLVLSGPERRLEGELGRGPAARRIFWLIVAGNHFEELAGTETLQRRAVNELLQDPAATLACISAALAGPSLRATMLRPARGFLLTLSARLPGRTEQARALLLRELTTPLPTPPLGGAEGGRLPAGRPEVTLLASAHELLLDLSPRRDLAAAGTRRALAAQRDPTVRRVLLEALCDRYPPECQRGGPVRSAPEDG